MRKLYIIVRTDLASMTQGRIAAQCAHAANMFVGEARKLIDYIEYENDPFVLAFNEWENQTGDHFGTTIVLNGGTEDEIKAQTYRLNGNYLTDFVIDPEYPIRDGKHTWIIPDVLTCAYAFCHGDEDIALKDLKLL